MLGGILPLTTSNCVHHTHRTFPADGRNLKEITYIGYITIQFINWVPFVKKSESRDCTCYGSGATEATGAHRSDSDRADIFVLGTTIR